MQKKLALVLAALAIAMVSGCSTSTSVRIGGSEMRHDEERQGFRDHAEELGVHVANRAGTTTVRYKMAEYSGHKPKIRLKDELESQVISAVLEYCLRAGMERLLADDMDRPSSRRSSFRE